MQPQFGNVVPGAYAPLLANDPKRKGPESSSGTLMSDGGSVAIKDAIANIARNREVLHFLSCIARFWDTSPVCRLYAQVEFRREMRPIACVDPGAFFVDNLGQLSKKPTLGQSPAIQAGALR